MLVSFHIPSCHGASHTMIFFPLGCVWLPAPPPSILLLVSYHTSLSAQANATSSDGARLHRARCAISPLAVFSGDSSTEIILGSLTDLLVKLPQGA